MSKRQFISLRTKDSNKEIDVEFPGDEPIEQLMPDLLKVLNWPAFRANLPIHYYLQNENEMRLDPQQSFNQLGIENFEVLWIFADEQASQQNSVLPSSPNQVPGADTFYETESEADALPAPVSAELPIDQPCLVSDSGLIFILEEKPILIGRKSKNTTPDIDISELDTEFICSRRHAEIGYSNGSYFIRAFNTHNGTLLNGNILNPVKPYQLKNGDNIQFGFRGVQVIFRQP